MSDDTKIPGLLGWIDMDLTDSYSAGHFFKNDPFDIRAKDENFVQENPNQEHIKFNGYFLEFEKTFGLDRYVVFDNDLKNGSSKPEFRYDRLTGMGGLIKGFDQYRQYLTDSIEQVVLHQREIIENYRLPGDNPETTDLDEAYVSAILKGLTTFPDDSPHVTPAPPFLYWVLLYISEHFVVTQDMTAFLLSRAENSDDPVERKNALATLAFHPQYAGICLEKIRGAWNHNPPFKNSLIEMADVANREGWLPPHLQTMINDLNGGTTGLASYEKESPLLVTGLNPPSLQDPQKLADTLTQKVNRFADLYAANPVNVVVDGWEVSSFPPEPLQEIALLYHQLIAVCYAQEKTMVLEIKEPALLFLALQKNEDLFRDVCRAKSRTGAGWENAPLPLIFKILPEHVWYDPLTSERIADVDLFNEEGQKIDSLSQPFPVTVKMNWEDIFKVQVAIHDYDYLNTLGYPYPYYFTLVAIAVNIFLEDLKNGAEVSHNGFDFFDQFSFINPLYINGPLFWKKWLEQHPSRRDEILHQFLIRVDPEKQSRLWEEVSGTPLEEEFGPDPGISPELSCHVLMDLMESWPFQIDVPFVEMPHRLTYLSYLADTSLKNGAAPDQVLAEINQRYLIPHGWMVVASTIKTPPKLAERVETEKWPVVIPLKIEKQVLQEGRTIFYVHNLKPEDLPETIEIKSGSGKPVTFHPKEMLDKYLASHKKYGLVGETEEFGLVTSFADGSGRELADIIMSREQLQKNAEIRKELVDAIKRGDARTAPYASLIEKAMKEKGPEQFSDVTLLADVEKETLAHEMAHLDYPVPGEFVSYFVQLGESAVPHLLLAEWFMAVFYYDAPNKRFQMHMVETANGTIPEFSFEAHVQAMMYGLNELATRLEVLPDPDKVLEDYADDPVQLTQILNQLIFALSQTPQKTLGKIGHELAEEYFQLLCPSI